jgi:hypothetical protein
MAERGRLEKMGEKSGEEKDTGQNRKVDGKVHKDKNICPCLKSIEPPYPFVGKFLVFG